jgi:DNA modification methylase
MPSESALTANEKSENPTLPIAGNAQPITNGSRLTEYETFLKSKRIVAEKTGIDVPPEAINPILYDFQRDITRWALKRGKAAIFEDCGLGKTLQQLEWARHVGGTVLIVAPLTVNEQTVKEGLKLGLQVRNVRDVFDLRECINITNYEMIRHFIGADLRGIVLDESSILKSIDGKTKQILFDHFTNIPFRLCCTATPCPNDIAEIANHSQFLGVMPRNEMLASFFVHDDEGWRLRGHAKEPFYRWLASWAMAMKSPSDLGYDGSLFELPPLNIHDAVVPTDWRRPGELFPGGLKGITDRISVRRNSIQDRVRTVADIANEADGQVIVWCALNPEASACARAIEGAENLQGTDSQERKRQVISDFVSGKLRVLVTKGKIAGFGMNFQNASTMIFMGLGDSYEMYYQCIRRCWRYGQKRPVDVYVVITDHEEEIVENVRRKEKESETLSRTIIAAANRFEKEELGRNGVSEKIETLKYSSSNWKIYQGDSAIEMEKIPSESVDLSIFSPPFLALYTYSATERDLGNSKNDAQFFEHFRFIIDGLMRITKPGRLCCVHCAQVATTLVNHGVIGVNDFRGKTVEQFIDNGWIYHGEVVIDKDPQAQAIRVHAKGLMFTQLKKDSSWLRPAMADYILVFRKPGENDAPIHPDIDNEQWIEWARPIWYGIRESDTLNTAEGRADEDDRHICALQLGTIERCVRLWSNPGETVFSPFAGIGSEGYVALQQGRKFIGIELKPLYARTAAKNLTEAEAHMGAQKGLFDAQAEA